MKTIGIENSKSSVQAHLTLGTKIMGLGIYGAYLALAIIYFWFGGMKFIHHDAEGLVQLVSNSPLLGWVYSIFSVDMFSSLLGILEISIGTLIAGRMLSPKLSVVGGALSAGLFFTTLSFMFSTPGVIEPSLGFPAISVVPGKFLLKDLGLLAVSIFVAGHSLVELEKRKINA